MSTPVFAKRPNYVWHDDTATQIVLAGGFLFIISNILLLIIFGNALYNSANDIDVNAGVGILISSLLSLLAFGGSAWALGVRKHPLKWPACGFRRTSWTMLALIVTSTAFGAVHLSSISLLSLSVAGAFCAVMYQYSSSLWNAIAVHAGNNGTVVILTYFVFKSSVFYSF